MDADSLLKELRIDWETLMTEDYNPLKQALRNKNSSAEASNFRNLFHKVEKVMESIIERSYKGFSDSVLSYMESYNLNKKCSDSILKISEATDDLLGINIDVQDMVKEYEEARFFEIKHGLCKVLLEIKRNFGEFCTIREGILEDMGKGYGDVSGRLLDAAKRISRIYELIRENELEKMGCIEKFKEEVDGEVDEFMKLICRRLDGYIFHNKCEYQGDFRCVAVLNTLGCLERHQMQNFEKEYFNMVESTIKSAGSETRENRLEEVVRMIMGRTQMVLRNFNSLWEMADGMFEGLHVKTANFFGEEETSFRIYSPEGGDVVEGIVQRVLERFVVEYVENPEKNFDEEEFLVDDFIDDIDYGSVFENKYLIHEKITHSSEYKVVPSGSFTRICAPTIEAVIFMRRYVFSEKMRRYLEAVLNEKYVKEKQSQVRKRIVYLFNDEDCCRSDYSNLRLWFYSRYDRYINEFSQYPEVCDVSSISDFLGECIGRRFGRYFSEVFRSEILKECFSCEDAEERICAFRRLVLVRVINRSTLFLQKQYYENVMFAVETLRDMDVLGDGRVREISDRICEGLRFQILLDVLYFFDLFYREGSYTNKDDYYLYRILKVVEDVYECASRLGVEGKYFDLIFGSLNFYIQNNVGRLNVRSADDLRAFSDKLRLLDEVLCLIGEEESLKESVSFIEDSISMSSNSENSKRLRMRANID